MDVIKLLSEEHRAVDQLFEKIEKTDSRGVKHREQLFQRLRRELEFHIRAEEEIFYREMEKCLDRNELVSEALKQHGEVKQILQEIAILSAEDDQWSEMVNELKMAVQHHVRAEEGQMFVAARRQLDQGRIAELGRLIGYMKETASA